MPGSEVAVTATFAEFARHVGVSKQAVSKFYRKRGFSNEAAGVVNGRAMIKDVSRASLEWAGADRSRASVEIRERAAAVAQKLRHHKAPPPPSAPLQQPEAIPEPTQRPREATAAATPFDELSDAPPVILTAESSLTDAQILEKYWSAKQKELKYQQDRRELVSAKEVEHQLAGLFTLCRTKLLAIPSKAKTALPNLSSAEVGTLDELIRQALEDLATTTSAVVTAPSGDATVAA